jgi:hypothetical protein
VSGTRLSATGRVDGEAEQLLHADVDARAAIGGVVDLRTRAGGRLEALGGEAVERPALLPRQQAADSGLQLGGGELGEAGAILQQGGEPVVEAVQERGVGEVWPDLRI